MAEVMIDYENNLKVCLESWADSLSLEDLNRLVSSKSDRLLSIVAYIADTPSASLLEEVDVDDLEEAAHYMIITRLMVKGRRQ